MRRVGIVGPEPTARSLRTPHSLVLTFGNGPNVVAAQLGADATGNWGGWAFALVGGAPSDGSMVPVRLVRTECGAVPLAISR